MRLEVSPTVGKAVQSTATVLVLMGPRREGKTVGGYAKLLAEAAQLPAEVLPLKAIVVRDTWTNLDKTTIETLRELQRLGLAVQFLKDSTEAILAGGLVHCYFFGVDRPQALNRFQGLGAGVLWIEEPAPAADLSSGVEAEVFGVGVTSLSQPGVRHFAMITMNPPDEDHWVMTVLDTLRALVAGRPGLPLTVEYLQIPKGENRYVSAEVRERNRAALLAIGRQDLVQRLVEGQVGAVVVGEPVTPEWSDHLHLAPEPLPILAGVEVLRGWDFGLTPTCFISQITPTGRWHWLDCLMGQNMGLEQMLDLYWFPWAERYLGAADAAGWRFRDIVDPAGFIREQSNSEHSAVRVLVDSLKASPERGAVEWSERLGAMKNALTRPSVRGVPFVQADRACRLVIQACRGRARYPKDPTGRVLQTVEAYKRASGLYSHPFDAAAVVASKVAPVGQRTRTVPVHARRPTGRVPERLGWMTA